jgi:hypothetical protein
MVQFLPELGLLRSQAGDPFVLRPVVTGHPAGVVPEIGLRDPGGLGDALSAPVGQVCFQDLSDGLGVGLPLLAWEVDVSPGPHGLESRGARGEQLWPGGGFWYHRIRSIKDGSIQPE